MEISSFNRPGIAEIVMLKEALSVALFIKLNSGS
jgi:hypothetical protein